MTSIKNRNVTNLLALLLILISFSLGSQNYGREWVDYDRRYFKFPIYREGIYRIDSLTLSGAFDLSVTDPRNISIHVRGQEQFIYVHGESDGKFNASDYIEFYAHASTAELDSMLYHEISHLPNPYVPIFCDTIQAFISVGPDPSPKRYQWETDTAFAMYPSAQYVYAEKIRAFPSFYNDVPQFDQGLSDPRYTQSEGFGDKFQKGGHSYLAFAGTYVYPSPSLPAYLTVAFSGYSWQRGLDYDHRMQVVYKNNLDNHVVLGDTTFAGYASAKKRYTLSSASLNSASEFSVVAVAAPEFASFSNENIVHYFHLLYPSLLNFSGSSAKKILIDNSATDPKSTYNFYGITLGNSTGGLLYDLTDGKRIPVTITGTGFWKAVIPNGSGRRQFYLTADSSAIRVTKMTPAGENGFFTDFAVGASKNPYVMIYHKALASASQAYRDYRSTAAGGGFSVLFTDVAQLYDQYAYGARKHPTAIRNYLRYLINTLPEKPANVLLIGAATTPNIYQASHSLNYIPTMGRPNSDNLLASGLSTPGKYDCFPELPIGRIAAISNGEVLDYLDKVKQHESTGQAEWKKDVLHFVGGDSEALSSELSKYMRNYESVIEDTLFGGQVRTFRKNSTEPVQVVLSDSIKEMVNKGAGLMTFFGHGSPYGFDQSIDEPELYSNAGKYPFLFANSCFSGDIHDPNTITVSKRFVFAKQKGSIGFLATTSLGFIYALDIYAGNFYRSLSYLRYNEGIGSVIREAARATALGDDPVTDLVGLDMTLHGDPAVKVSNGLLPDYTLQNKDVRFDLAKHRDSIEVSVAYKNIGMALRDSIVVTLERFYPGNDTSLTFRVTPAALFRDTVIFLLPVEGTKGVGLNYFRVRLDQLSQVAEANENNNATTGLIELFVPGNDIIPVYPYQFAVVPRTGSITLKASTVDAYAPTAGYIFQVDTTDSFASPVASTLIVSRGGVIEWPLPLPFRDSTVFYWRVTRDSTNPLHRISWRSSSFQTLDQQMGWGQAHFDQFLNNGYQLVSPKKNLRQFIFENRLNTINARAGFHPYLHESQQTWYFNNNQMDSWSCTFNGWNFALFDSISGEPRGILNPNWPSSATGAFGNCLCGRSNKYHYTYYFGKTNGECGPNPDLTWKTKVENFLNAIPPNTYVLGYTTGNPSGTPETSTYSEPLYQAFESIGSGSIRTTPDTVSMVIFGKKGMLPGQAKEIAGASHRAIVYTQDSIRTKWNNGFIASPQIGPAYKWHNIHWRLRSLDATPGDSSVLKVLGIRADGTADTLQSVGPDTPDLVGIESFIDAGEFPFMKLIVFMRDNVHSTSPQLRSWHVLFDEAPECALNPLRQPSAIRDSVQEGETFTYVFPVENIGVRNFEDSLSFTYWVEDAQRTLLPVSGKLRPPPFVPGQVIFDTVKVDSYKLQGSNGFWITVNSPADKNYQKEQHYFNNLARVPFSVSGDVTNPLLDVTFDGRRILNGDIVSAKPAILITLKDENKFLLLNDTSAFSVSLQAPGQASPQRIYFAQGLQFTPASGHKNSASILYTPELKTDGKYTLVAQARDRSNNRSGAHEYKIEFEINNKPTITNVLNYPNPFTTSTRFVFTLTGSEIPEVFTIQILTVTGKVVREITRAELGTLRIGRNITDYAWDGRDNFGDRLGSGVYLYRVRTKLNGSDVEKQSSGADRYFNREYGKMVLMR